MTGSDFPNRTEGEGATIDLPEGFLAPGQVLGDRYQIRSQLGRGGMGEVWRAFDLKLRVEVALKALLPELFKDEKRRDMLRREVRAAREVVSPNVCRIFDLIEVDGRELVSMEYVDGGTLLGVLQERGPLDLKEAQDIASQFLAGLEAIHQAGLVHRDVKPENIMLTRAGRVVLMDFGLARGPDSDAGTVSGTPAYMAPEQAAGLDVDARADVYSAGVVLAEMVSPDGIKDLQSRQSVWEGIRHEPARVPDSPWAPVLKKAVAKEPDHRYNSAHTLTRALEEVTLRVEGAEDLSPYPGLASFTEEDAEYFFGREAEVEAMWAKLERPHLMALIGPSGAGKSSFIRAGLIPAQPAGWVHLICAPGINPFISLAQAIAPELSGDTEAIGLMVQFEVPEVAVELFGRWRKRYGHALVIIDQFEELFTQNTPDVQARFAELIGRLALEADVHVLLSMRDDFLMRCNDPEALGPIFSELTPLKPLTGSTLRRALVQPGMKCGYRFEDDNLVDEMVLEVEGERGALPLAAFAMARLWEKRDRHSGLMTRRAYLDVGGVGGALANHAEATLEKIGVERLPIVRELFRNLVTADVTRAVREWEELLSVFSDSQVESPEEVLRALIDARLLTSYEVREEEEKPTRRVEIIHESLLTAWPRLVRWQAQDEEGARLRDELRHAARAWEERARPDDRLWTGTAFREFELWRERYPGRLTGTEEAFADAMTAFAGRRRRIRRVVVAAVMAALIAGLTVVGTFWRRSVLETRRAEAQKLIALGQLELDLYPSAAVAHAIASLELADSTAARRLSLEALWKGPTAFVVNENPSLYPEFSRDGRWLVQSFTSMPNEILVTQRDGTSTNFDPAHDHEQVNIRLNPTGHVLYSEDAAGRQSPQHLVLWSVPDGRRLADVRYNPPAYLAKYGWNDERALVLVFEAGVGHVDAVSFDGTVSRLGSPDLDFEFVDWIRQTAVDSQTGRWLGVVEDGEVSVIEIRERGLSQPRSLGRHDGSGILVEFHPQGDFLATANSEGEIRLWDPTGARPPTTFQGPPGIRGVRFSTDGFLLEAIVEDEGVWKPWVWSLTGDSPRFVRSFDLGGTGWGDWLWHASSGQVARWGPDTQIRLWSMDAPADAGPLVLSRGDVPQLNSVVFSPQGRWLAGADIFGLAVWPLARQYPRVIQRHDLDVTALVFAPDGTWIASSSMDRTVRLWPLSGESPPPGRTIMEVDRYVNSLATSPDGGQILVGTGGGRGVWILRPDGGSPSKLEGFNHDVAWAAFSNDGQLAAAVGGGFDPSERVIRIWDVESQEIIAILEVGERPRGRGNLQFTPEGHLLSVSDSGLFRWDVKSGKRELLYEGHLRMFSADAAGRRVIMAERENEDSIRAHVLLLDVDSGTTTRLLGFGDDVGVVAIDPGGEFAATGDLDGEVRVGLLSGGEPHLLLGHERPVVALAIDPLGRWIASGGQDTTVRLWPMPDLSKPPLQTFSHDDLIAKLRSLTNLRMVRDPDSTTGWKLTHDPFPGWETVPTW